MFTSLTIAIAGAGPAGLAAALYLDRQGHRVTVFERFEKPAPVGSGLILQPTGLTVLADLGLADELVLLGARLERLTGSDATTGRTVLDVRYGAQKGGRFGLGVHRAALFGVLHRAVTKANIEIVTGLDLREMEPQAGSVDLIDTAGRRHGGFDLLVDATGGRSVLKRHAFHACEPKPLLYGAFWASLDWQGSGFDRHALMQRYDKASVMVGVLPIGRLAVGGADMAAFFWSLKPTEAEAVRGKGIEAWRERVLALWPECEAFTCQIKSFDDLSLARYGHHTLSLPVGRRLAVIGDAAHSTSPQLGQGANMALLDARALAFALEQNKDLDRALEAYAAMRRKHVRVFQALSRLFTPFYQSDSTMLPFLRDRLVATLAQVPPTPQLLASMVAGTVVDPFGPVGLKEMDWSKLPAVGDRALSVAGLVARRLADGDPIGR